MNKKTLWERCRISTNKENDLFVGIKLEEKDISITFPLGYDCSVCEDDLLRKDIVSLITVLQKVEKSGTIPSSLEVKDSSLSNFPILSYQHIILDYLKNGYITEKEVLYNTGTKGKINWKHTIQKKKPHLCNKDIIYLDFIVKRNILSNDAVLTKIHEFCVYESFVKLGWLFTEMLPQKPRIQFNKKKFISFLIDIKSKTYDDKKILLINSMIDVINSIINKDYLKNSFTYGTYHFEIIWEQLIDKVFGDIDKEQYYPQANWSLIDGQKLQSSFLRPDTIIKKDGKIYIIDAKYYKYGVTHNKNHLPPTTSIHKQITYGEYINCNHFKQRNLNEDDLTVYNIFLLPFNKSKNNDSEYKYFGTATADWKNNSATYETVHGVFLDMKHLIDLNYSKNCTEINRLINLIIEIVDVTNK